MRFLFKIKKFMAKAVASLIPCQRARKRVRNFLVDWSFLSVARYLGNGAKAVRPNSILIFEPNRCHGECIPGYARYFLDMGFNVDVLMHRAVEVEHPCHRISQEEKLSLNGSNCIMMRLWMNKKRAGCYKAILINSSALYWVPDENRLASSTIDHFNLRDMKNLLIVEHDLMDAGRFHEISFLEAGRLLTLGRFSRGTMVNPHYFGKIRVSPKNSTTRFIVVGNITERRKRHSLIFDAISRLKAAGIDNFEIVIVGGGGSLGHIPGGIRSHIHMRGRLDYPEMYDEMEKADFYLPLLDPDNESHNRYITTGVTGSALLIYGFLKPCLIHGKFAAFYGFNKANSIIYEDDFAASMKCAVEMDAAGYAGLQNQLKSLADSLYAESMGNLTRIVMNGAGTDCPK